MFNNYSVPQTVHINAACGTIVKNYQDSFILRFHMKSTMAEQLLCKEPGLKHHCEFRPVVVLQVMLCGEQEFLAEVMWKDDFDKIFEPKEESETAE
jgi:hypothetical protein